MATGRPSKRTPEVVEQIVASIKSGSFAHVAASAAGIHRATFYRWMDEDEDFRDKVEAAASHARGIAEASVFRDKPEVWLRYGPGKSKPDAEGWTETKQIEVSGRHGLPVSIRALLDEADGE
jgi:hypothetical protein